MVDAQDSKRKALLIYLHGAGEAGLSLALGFIKAYADADEAVHRAWTIDILHECLETDHQEIVSAIERSGAEVVGFSCYSWNIAAVLRVVDSLDAGSRPLIVLGGVEVTPKPVRVLQKHRVVDVVVVGEGEATFRALLARLAEDRDAASTRDFVGIEGIAWRKGRALRSNPARPPIADLASIPSPYLTGAFGDSVAHIRTVPVETTRGCPFCCAYCFEGRGFKTVRTFPLERVKAELRHLADQGVKEIEFFDTNMNHDRKRAVEIFRFLHSLGRRMRFWFELRAELLDQEQIRALTELEFFAEVGLQTTNPRALRAVHRTLNREKFVRAIQSFMGASIYRQCRSSARLGLMIDVIAGLPYDSVDDVRRTFDFAFGLTPSKIGVSIMKILPGTELYDKAKKFRYAFDPDDDHIIRSSSTLSEQDVRDLINFNYAVEQAYNKLHAVRTIAWMASELGSDPSDVFMAIGRHMASGSIPWANYRVKDLGPVLAGIGQERGNAQVADKVVSKLIAESCLNALQRSREKRRSWLSGFFFSVGFRFLRRFGGLAPLPRFTVSVGPSQRLPHPRGERPEGRRTERTRPPSLH